MTDDQQKAVNRLGTRYGMDHWNNAGYFDVPGAAMRELVDMGYAEVRKRSGSSPAEYRGTFAAVDGKASVPWVSRRG
jgi:hypothetical protein